MYLTWKYVTKETIEKIVKVIQIRVNRDPVILYSS